MPWQAGSRVLIVDSDLEIRRRLSAKLLEADIFADCEATLDGALSTLADTRYAIVLLDLGIPGDRDLLIARLADMPLGERPIVIATGMGEAARNVSADVVQIVLRRPISVVIAADLIRSCLRPMGPRRPAPRPAGKKGDQPAS